MEKSTLNPARAFAIGALALFVALQCGSAEARERAAAGARAGASPGAGAIQRTRVPPAGRDWTRTTETQRTDGGFRRNTTVTNGQGQTATRSVEVARDRAAGTSTRNVDYTTFDGRSGSIDSTTTRTENGFTRATSGTLPNGESFSRTVVRQCDGAAKTCSTTVENDGRGASN
jgi:hypothetical protein